jgi:hypothetical protein
LLPCSGGYTGHQDPVLGLGAAQARGPASYLPRQSKTSVNNVVVGADSSVVSRRSPH